MTDRMVISDVDVEHMKKVAHYFNSKVVRVLAFGSGSWEMMFANEILMSLTMRRFGAGEPAQRNSDWQINFVRRPGEATEKAYIWCIYDMVLGVEKVGLELKPYLKPWPVLDGSAEWELDISLNRTGEIDNMQYFHLKIRYGGNTYYLDHSYGSRISLLCKPVPMFRLWRARLCPGWSDDSYVPKYTCLKKKELGLSFHREAKVVIRLRSRWGTYLTASDDKQSVILQPSITKNTEWTLKYSTSSSLTYKFNIWSIYDKILGITEGGKEFRLSQLNWPISDSSTGVREWELQINSRNLSDDFWGMLVDRNSTYILLPCADGSVMFHRHPCPVNRVIEDEVNWKIEVVSIEEPRVIKNSGGKSGNSSYINTGHNVNGSGKMTVGGIKIQCLSL